MKISEDHPKQGDKANDKIGFEQIWWYDMDRMMYMFMLISILI